MAEVVELRVVPTERPAPYVNADAVALVEGLLERLKSGHSVSVAMAEVYAEGGIVATAYSAGDRYHQLCSGCARLAARIALD